MVAWIARDAASGRTLGVVFPKTDTERAAKVAAGKVYDMRFGYVVKGDTDNRIAYRMVNGATILRYTVADLLDIYGDANIRTVELFGATFTRV